MQTLFIHPLETAINSYLRLDQDTITRLATLQGKVILLIIEDWNTQFYLVPTNNGVELHSSLSTAADTTITAKLDALFHLSRQADSNSALFKNRVDVEGDLETGEKIRDILSQIDIDWEEHLAKCTNDVFAHNVGKAARSLKQVVSQSVNTLQVNLNEFLLHEVRLLPSRLEVTNFINQVSTLRNDIDRLEARLNHISQPGSKQS